MLILDEPTASIDPRSEHKAFQRFAEIAKTPTTLFITHRLASVRIADRVLVMKDDEQWQPQYASKILGEYTELWHMQATTYLELLKVAKQETTLNT
ncbi:MAG: hypothetical protein ACRCYY_12470 [Trueperaceae bacterium]